MHGKIASHACQASTAIAVWLGKTGKSERRANRVVRPKLRNHPHSGHQGALPGDQHFDAAALELLGVGVGNTVIGDEGMHQFEGPKPGK